MNKIQEFIFPTPPSAQVSAIILSARVIFGVLLMSHGLDKIIAFDDYAISFPDPFGVGGLVSLIFVIFAEVFCAMGFILGVLFRLCLIPMIITMCVAVFVIHSGDPLGAKEPALMYLVIFSLLFVSGPGRFSVDASLRSRFPNM